jgi:hypothetical protein
VCVSADPVCLAVRLQNTPSVLRQVYVFHNGSWLPEVRQRVEVEPRHVGHGELPSLEMAKGKRTASQVAGPSHLQLGFRV